MPVALRRKTRQQLEDYCRRDSWAMVAILEKLDAAV
jgi:hypothetical protein